MKVVEEKIFLMNQIFISFEKEKMVKKQERKK